MIGTTEQILSDLRSKTPLVQCITNYVAMNFAANAVLASGGSPAMVHAREEAALFVEDADALTINIGTLSATWVAAMVDAAKRAAATDTPWVLDPVAAGATPYRLQTARRLLAFAPTILRGNASEILSLASATTAGRGVDSTDSVAAAETAATALAQRIGCVTVVTGAVDFVTDGGQSARVSGGSPMMAKVTAMGCALTAVAGACVAVAKPFDAAVAALSLFAAAGERAACRCEGPGSFHPAFLDGLAAATPADLAISRRVTWR